MTKSLEQMLQQISDEKLEKQKAMDKQASMASNTPQANSLEQVYQNVLMNKQASAPQVNSQNQPTADEMQALQKMAYAYATDLLRTDAITKQANAYTPEQQRYVVCMDMNKRAYRENVDGWNGFINYANQYHMKKQAFANQYGAKALEELELQQKQAQEEQALGRLWGMGVLSGYNKAAAEADPANTNPSPQANTAALGGNGAPSQVPDDSTKEDKAKELTIMANPFQISPAGTKKQTANLANTVQNMSGVGAGGTLGTVGGTAVQFVNPLKN